MCMWHCPVSNSSCKQISIFTAAVLFHIYSSLPMRTVFKAQMCFTVLWVNDLYFRVSAYYRVSSMKQKPMRTRCPELCLLPESEQSWHQALQGLTFPVHQECCGTRVRLYQRGFVELLWIAQYCYMQALSKTALRELALDCFSCW